MEIRTGLDVLMLRRTAGLTQGELSRRSGIERSCLSRIEWSRRELDPQKADRIRRALEPAGVGTGDVPRQVRSR